MIIYDSLWWFVITYDHSWTSLVSSVISTFYRLSTKRTWTLTTVESHQTIRRKTLTTGDRVVSRFSTHHLVVDFPYLAGYQGFKHVKHNASQFKGYGQFQGLCTMICHSRMLGQSHAQQIQGNWKSNKPWKKWESQSQSKYSNVFLIDISSKELEIFDWNTLHLWQEQTGTRTVEKTDWSWIYEQNKFKSSQNKANKST